MTRREWDTPRALARLDQARSACVNKRLIDDAEAALEYAAWRQQTELEVELRYGTTFDPDNPRSMPTDDELRAIEAEQDRRRTVEEDWLRFLDDTGLL